MLLPKGNRGLRGVILVKVLWKNVLGILNRSLTLAIFYHDTLHGLLSRQGTGTASLNAKLPHNLATMRGEVLYEIFLDIHNTYDTFD